VTKERPILFSAPMVRAILAGRKTQTRRVVHERLYVETFESGRPLVRIEQSDQLFGESATRWARCPYGAPGSRLWVRERWACLDPASRTPVIYATDRGPKDYRWRPSIHMPRWASRITLEVTNVRVERLQSITEEDARAEGVEVPASSGNGARDWFAAAWDDLNECRGYPWASSPWVWVISFSRLDDKERAA
jgi:hypothetical protein